MAEFRSGQEGDVPGEAEIRSLTEREEAMWLLQEMFPDQGVASVALSVRLPDDVEMESLAEAIRWVVQCHPPLRSLIRMHNGRPIRSVRGTALVQAAVEVLASTPDRLRKDMRAVAGRAFDLTQDEPVRFAVFELPDGRRELLLTAHHLAFDALSAAPFVDQMAAAYESFAATGLPPARRPAARALPEEQPAAPESLRYWKKRIHGIRPDAMKLYGTDYSGTGPSFRGARYAQALSPAATQAVDSLRRYTRTTDNVVLLAAYLLLLHRHGAGEDLVAGVALDSRPEDQPELIGHHFSVVPLRLRLMPGEGFSSFAGRTLDALLEALEHRDVSYETMTRESLPDDYAWQTPLFRHLFNFRPASSSVLAASDWDEEIRQVDTGYSRFDLEAVVTAGDNVYGMQIVYQSDLHDEGFAARFYDRYEALLRSAAADPERTVGALSIATAHDRVIEHANRTAATWPSPQTTAGLVAQHIRDRPQSIALTGPDGDVTYAELDRTAAGIAGLLTQGGVHAGDVVAIAASRGLASAAGTIAAWRVGAAYLPMDPSHPAERLRAQLRDAGAAAIIATAETARRLGDQVPFLIGADDVAASANAIGPALTEPEPQPDDIAYLIYTSGSTGRPKGVQITHGNLANVVRHFGRVLDFSPAKAMAWLTTFSFDISALELFLPLSCGGRVVVADDQAQVNPRRLMELASGFGADVVQATPTVWRIVSELDDLDLGGRWVLCGGEPLTASLAQRLVAAGARLLNVYGPSETTIWSTAELLDGQHLDAQLAVGVPIANTTVAVRDQFGNDCPVGILGEVVIGGAGVGVGYLGRPDLTEERFVDGKETATGRGYRTGDLGLWRPDGRLELHGRMDRQVKINGQRLELGEVEAVLESHPDVTGAAVVTYGSGDGVQRLAGFVASQSALAADELWAFAARRLPSYAVPGAIQVLSGLPANKSGKVDYPRLSELAAAQRPGAALASPTDTPPDEVVAWLVTLWQDLLENPDLGADSNFFLAGGQSLLAIDIARRVMERYDIHLPLVTLFNNPTPRALRAELPDHSPAGRPALSPQETR